MHHATQEVEQVLGKLRDTGLARAVHASGVAAAWGVNDGANLRELAAAAPEGPWGELLTAHLQAMTVLVAAPAIATGSGRAAIWATFVPPTVRAGAAATRPCGSVAGVP